VIHSKYTHMHSLMLMCIIQVNEIGKNESEVYRSFYHSKVGWDWQWVMNNFEKGLVIWIFADVIWDTHYIYSQYIKFCTELTIISLCMHVRVCVFIELVSIKTLFDYCQLASVHVVDQTVSDYTLHSLCVVYCIF